MPNLLSNVLKVLVGSNPNWDSFSNKEAKRNFSNYSNNHRHHYHYLVLLCRWLPSPAGWYIFSPAWCGCCDHVIIIKWLVTTTARNSSFCGLHRCEIKLCWLDGWLALWACLQSRQILIWMDGRWSQGRVIGSSCCLVKVSGCIGKQLMAKRGLRREIFTTVNNVNALLLPYNLWWYYYKSLFWLLLLLQYQSKNTAHILFNNYFVTKIL